MRGSPRGQRRGRKPGNPSNQGKQLRVHHSDALLGSDSFMRSIAATEDRRKFDRLTSTPAQSQQKPSLPRANQQGWHPAQRAPKYEVGSTVRGNAISEEVGVIQATTDSDSSIESASEGLEDTVDLLFDAVCSGGFPVDPQIRKEFGFEGLESLEDQQKMLGLWHGIFILLEVEAKEVRRWRDEGTLRQSIIQLHDTRGTSSRYFAWFKRNRDILPTPAWVAGRYKTKTPGRPLAYTQATFTGNKVPRTPRKALLGNSSTAWGQSREKGSAWKLANIDDTSTIMNAVRTKTVNSHQLGTLPKKADFSGTQSQRYDIATLKHWQPAKGGTTLAIAKKAALQMRALLLPEDEPSLDRPAVAAEDVKHAVNDLLYQAHKADERDAGDDSEIREPAILHSAIPTQTLPVGAAKVIDNIGLLKENTSQAAIRLNTNVNLLGLNDNPAPLVDGEDMAKVSIPRRPTRPGTGNAWTSTLSDTPFQSQDIISEGGTSTGGEWPVENETGSLIGSDNTLVNDKAEEDGATEQIIAVGHTTTKDPDKTGSTPEVTVDERDTKEDGRTHSRAEIGFGLKTEERDSTINAGAGEVNTTKKQLLIQDGNPEKDMDIVEEVSKEVVLVDHFRWLLPAKFH